MAWPAAIHLAAWLARTFPTMPGRWRVVRWLEQREHQVSALPPQDVHVAGGLRMRVDPRDENGRRVFVAGFDPRERLTRLFIDLLSPGDNVLDIGANAGYYTMVAAHLVGPSGQVHAFEASPYVLPWLQNSVRLSGRRAANIHVHGVAVTDRPGEVAFHAAMPEKTGFSSIRDLGRETAATTIVPSTSIDRMLDELPPIRLVKMDIEGAELMALRGMTRLINRDQPWFITEVDDQFLRSLGGSAAELFEFFISHRYQVARVIEQGESEPLRKAPLDRCNLIASPGPLPLTTETESGRDAVDHQTSQMTPVLQRPGSVG